MSDLSHQVRPARSGDIMKMFEGPDEASLSEAERVLVDQSRLAFRELEKLLKNTSLYGTSHESTGRFRTRFFEALSQCFVGHRALEIVLGPYSFSLFGQVIYENPNPEKNFIYKFYIDGIRRIIFQPALRAAELDDFVDVLLINWSDPTLFEDDAVTVLWGKEFENIEYSVVQSFDQDTQEHEEHHFTIAGVIEEVRRAGQASRNEASRRARKGRPPVSPLVALTSENLEHFQATEFAIDEVEFNTLRGLLGANARETLEKFIEIVFKVRLTEDNPEQIKRIEQLFDRISGLLMQRGRIGDLERLLRKILRLRGPHGISNPLNIRVIGHIFKHWTRPDFIHPIIASLDDPNSPYLPSVQALCALLVPDGALTIALAVGDIAHPPHRAALFAQLPTLIRGRAYDVARLLNQLKPAHAHAMLVAISAQKSPEATQLAVRTAMANKDASVRYEAMSVLTPADVPYLLDVLFSALEDSTKKVRSKALHLLARVRSEEVQTHFIEAIEHKGFIHFDLDEKRRYFAAVALSGEAREYLLDKLNSHSGFLARKHHDEERHCAAIALGIRMCKEAIPVFKSELRRRIRNELVYTGCRWAVQHVQRDRDTRTRQIFDIFYRSELTGLEVSRGR